MMQALLKKRGISNAASVMHSKRTFSQRFARTAQTSQFSARSSLIGMMLLAGCTATAATFLSSKGLTNPFVPSQPAFAQAMNDQVRKIKLNELVSSESTLLRGGSGKAVAIFYDSRVGTHSEYLSILGVKQTFARLKGYQVLLVDLAEQTAEDIASAEPFLKGQLSIDLAKVGRKTSPSVFLQINDSLHKVKPETLKAMPDFQQLVDRVSRVKLASSIKDLVTSLKQNNTKLDSLTIVYCTDGAPERRELEQKALRVLAHETEHQILEVRDLEMARFIKMEPGKFYCYYRPSFVNGYPSDPSGNPMQNKEALQILEGICRDELTIVDQEMSSLNPKLLITEQVTNTIFDRVFQSTFDVKFNFNPNMRAFKRNRLNPNQEKPILIIYQDQFMMTMTNNIFQEVTQDYQEFFDMYICEDAKQLNELVYFKDTHPQLPIIRIIDPSKRTPVEKIKQTKSFLKAEFSDSKEEAQTDNSTEQSYPLTQEIVFMPVHHQPSKLKDQIEQFLDGTNKNGDPLQNHFQTEKFKPNVLAKMITTDTFKKEVLDDRSFEHCIVEVFGDHCGGCQAAAVIMGALTNKMKKHGYLSEMPLFQMKQENEVPFLGQVGYTPAFFYLRKDKATGQIKEIKTLEKWQYSEKFVPQLAECSGLPGLSDRVAFKWREQMGKHFNKVTLQDGFDYDFDMVDGAKFEQE